MQKSRLESSPMVPVADDWFHNAFGEDYLWIYAHRSDEEAEFQVGTIIDFIPFQPRQKILDVACGSGRHMLAFARRGGVMTGVDLSQPLLKIAREKFRAKNYKVTLKKADMRRLNYRAKFDGATLWFTSFGYFASSAEDQKALINVCLAIKPGGWWLIDLPNPLWLAENLVPESERVAEGPNGRAKIIEKRRLINDTVEKNIIIMDSMGRKEYAERVRLYRPEQFAAMVSRVDFTIDGVLGEYDGRPLSRESRRQIWFGRRKMSSR